MARNPTITSGDFQWPSEFEIDGTRVGRGHPPFLIAEAGINHNGKLKIAMELVEAAADAGASAIKFQTFEPQKLVSRLAAQGAYQKKATKRVESQFEMLQRLVLSRTAFGKIRRLCDEKGISFLSTPFDQDSFNFLMRLGVPAFKLSSGDITNLPFIRKVAASKRPIILSTGMSSLDEIKKAVSACRLADASVLCLLQCVSAYPSRASSSNLRVMSTYAREFRTPVGFSDHTLGIHVAIAAVACGACIIEKHFTLSRSLPGPDHGASVEPAELRELQFCLKEVHSALGDGSKRVTREEKANISIARRSLHWAVSLPRGAIIAEENVLALRPEGGVPPEDIPKIVGRVLIKDVKLGSQVLRHQFRDAR